MELTKDADALICLMYKQYVQKRKDKISKSQAKIFGSSDNIQKNIAPKWSFEDVDETCRELSRAKLLNCSYADDVVYSAYLSDEAIIYMENRFPNGLSQIIQALTKLSALVAPWL